MIVEDSICSIDVSKKALKAQSIGSNENSRFNNNRMTLWDNRANVPILGFSCGSESQKSDVVKKQNRRKQILGAYVPPVDVDAISKQIWASIEGKANLLKVDGKFFAVGVGVNGQNPTNTYKGEKMHE